MIEVNVGSSVQNDSDEMVNRARKRIAVMKGMRWFMLAYGLGFSATAAYLTVRAVTRLGSLDERQLTMGFVYGVVLGITWVAFGLLAGLCIGKFLAGCQRDNREREFVGAVS